MLRVYHIPRFVNVLSANYLTEAGYRSCSTKILPPGSILFSSRAPIGHCAVTTFPLCTNQGFKSIIPNDRLDAVYGLFALKYFTPSLQALGRGATFTEINKEIFGDFVIPLPPLDEQRRIAAILQRADRLRRLRRLSRQLSDTFLQSVFLQMFGDPATNPMGWEMRPLPEVVNINPALGKNTDNDTLVSFVPMSAVDETRAEVIPVETRIFRDVKTGYTPFIEDDVLFAKITPCMENGKAAIAKNLVNGIGMGSTEFHVMRATQKTRPEWILWLIKRIEFRKRAALAFTGTAGQQRVPSSFFDLCLIPIPPVDLQERFAEICHCHENTLRGVREASRQSEQLFQTLLARAFSEI